MGREYGREDRGWRGRASYFVTHHDELGHACRRSTLTERVPCRFVIITTHEEGERTRGEERMGGRTGCDYEAELVVV